MMKHILSCFFAITVLVDGEAIVYHGNATQKFPVVVGTWFSNISYLPVSGELALADPIDACETLKNNVSNKVIVVLAKSERSEIWTTAGCGLNKKIHFASKAGVKAILYVSMDSRMVIGNHFYNSERLSSQISSWQNIDTPLFHTTAQFLAIVEQLKEGKELEVEIYPNTNDWVSMRERIIYSFLWISILPIFSMAIILLSIQVIRIFPELSIIFSLSTNNSNYEVGSKPIETNHAQESEIATPRTYYPLTDPKVQQIIRPPIIFQKLIFLSLVVHLLSETFRLCFYFTGAWLSNVLSFPARHIILGLSLSFGVIQSLLFSVVLPTAIEYTHLAIVALMSKKDAHSIKSCTADIHKKFIGPIMMLLFIVLPVDVATALLKGIHNSSVALDVISTVLHTTIRLATAGICIFHAYKISKHIETSKSKSAVAPVDDSTPERDSNPISVTKASPSLLSWNNTDFNKSLLIQQWYRTAFYLLLTCGIAEACSVFTLFIVVTPNILFTPSGLVFSLFFVFVSLEIASVCRVWLLYRVFQLQNGGCGLIREWMALRYRNRSQSLVQGINEGKFRGDESIKSNFSAVDSELLPILHALKLNSLSTESLKIRSEMKRALETLQRCQHLIQGQLGSKDDSRVSMSRINSMQKGRKISMRSAQSDLTDLPDPWNDLQTGKVLGSTLRRRSIAAGASLEAEATMLMERLIDRCQSQDPLVMSTLHEKSENNSGKLNSLLRRKSTEYYSPRDKRTNGLRTHSMGTKYSHTTGLRQVPVSYTELEKISKALVSAVSRATEQEEINKKMSQKLNEIGPNSPYSTLIHTKSANIEESEEMQIKRKLSETEGLHPGVSEYVLKQFTSQSSAPVRDPRKRFSVVAKMAYFHVADSHNKSNSEDDLDESDSLCSQDDENLMSESEKEPELTKPRRKKRPSTKTGPLKHVRDSYLFQPARELLKRLDKWDFDVFEATELSLKPLVFVAHAAFAHLDMVADFLLPVEVLCAFLDEVESLYLISNCYHNSIHAADVVQTMTYTYLTCGVRSTIRSPELVFSGIFAAIIHDVGHPGVNNPFLIQAKHHLAIRYNDRSPLENMHCALGFELLEDHNFLEHLKHSQYTAIRKSVVEMVLATDNAMHADYLGKFKAKVETSLLDSWEDRNLLMQVLLHACDVSNPAKPWSLCLRWANNILEEFYSQGDRQRDLGQEVMPIMDREANIPLWKFQSGFITAIVQPLFTAIAKHPTLDLSEPISQLESNLNHWVMIRESEEKSTVETKHGTNSPSLSQRKNPPLINIEALKLSPKNQRRESGSKIFADPGTPVKLVRQFSHSTRAMASMLKSQDSSNVVYSKSDSAIPALDRSDSNAHVIPNGDEDKLFDNA